MSFVAIFILLLLIQYALSIGLQLLGLRNPYIIDTIIDLVLAFIFAFVYYRGPKKEAIKDYNFHRSVAMYFVVLILFSMVYWFIIW